MEKMDEAQRHLKEMAQRMGELASMTYIYANMLCDKQDCNGVYDAVKFAREIDRKAHRLTTYGSL